jgi:hypothetical protein
MIKGLLNNKRIKKDIINKIKVKRVVCWKEWLGCRN